MKNRIIILLVSLSLCGCDGFFDTFPQDKVTDEKFWQSENDALKFVTDIYASSFSSSSNGSPFWDEAMSDNAHMVWDWYGGQQQLANGTQNSYGKVPTDVWSKRYENIRKCFQFLENVDKVSSASEDVRARLSGEVRFLLAYNYYHLVSYFSNIPIVKKVMTIEESKSLVQSPKEETVAYILEELDKAAESLKGKELSFGQITWGACQALKARVLLFDAQWKEALTVTDGLLGKYDLNTQGDTPYEDLFSGVNENSREVILSLPRQKSAGSLKTGHSANEAFLLKGISGGDPYRGIMPTGALVDAYPMSNGCLIGEKGSTYDPKKPYENRDPRFYQSIIYPTGQIRFLDAATSTIQHTLYDPEDPTTIPVQQYNASEPSATGYMWNKYVDWSVYAMNEILDCTNDIVLFRYAEILLIRAEALAELNGVGAKNEICDLLDQLRSRCKGGLIHRENYTSPEQLINLVRNERRVELAGEGLRYFDLIRWKTAEKSIVENGYGLKGELYGAYMRLDGVGKEDRTVKVSGVPRRYVETRFFDPAKNYLNPIPQSEIDLNPSLKQNPNW